MDPTPGEAISLSLRMAKAMALARAGQLREAQKVVADERTIPDDMLALHALAALVTSEGDNLRALKLWELLLQRDPGHAEAKRMIAAIEVWILRPFWFRYLPLIGSVIGVAVIATILFWAMAAPPPKTKASPFRTDTQTPISPQGQINDRSGPVGVPDSNSNLRVVSPTPLPPISFPATSPKAVKKKSRP